MKQKSFKSMALVAILMFGIFLLTPSLRSQEKSGRSIFTWNNSDDGKKIEVKVEDQVDFNNDYSDVSTVTDDGALRIFDSRGPRNFRLVVTRGAGGELRRDYSVDGQSRSFDAEGHFKADLMLRTEWLHAVHTIGSDYEHHRALSGALKANELSAEALSGLVESATRIQSDYEKASFLLEAMNHYRTDARLRSAFVDAAKTIGSEYERGRVQKRFDMADF